MQLIDKPDVLGEIDEYKTTKFIYPDGTIVFALDKDTCQRIVIKF